ncbi:putative two-component response regulator ARR20 isoform X2 [Impatiens glandulifera]|uniref:putative two-component response regulator ARR20 isoform X2 n=1 Tax=Impatiens glandulifera TaxID=253017 RepID=UPI001FB158A6|nr:putative two-component response regulator ARR20 isoform X2 [Impatiens glandulifera]
MQDSKSTTHEYSISKNHDYDEEEKEEKDRLTDEVESKKSRKKANSSNSTIEKLEKKNTSSNNSGSVRKYIRSKNPRLRWTPDLHICFVRAVERLGGQDRATPKLVHEMMNVKGLSIAHVKSHLQMYRSKKVDDPNNQGILPTEGFIMNGRDQISNFGQLPLLQTLTQIPNANFRYEGAWGAFTNPNTITYSPRQGNGYTHLQMSTYNSFNNHDQMSHSSHQGRRAYEDDRNGPKIFQPNYMTIGSPNISLQTHQQYNRNMGSKRKIMEVGDENLDLDLSLKISEKRRDDYGDHKVKKKGFEGEAIDCTLSLSIKYRSKTEEIEQHKDGPIREIRCSTLPYNGMIIGGRSQEASK